MANLFKKKYLHVPKVPISNIWREVGKNPFVDWIIILILSTVVALILIVGGVNLYIQIISGDIGTTNTASKSTKKVFDPRDLSSVIKRFEDKESTSLKIRNGYGGPSDPSILGPFSAIFSLLIYV